MTDDLVKRLRWAADNSNLCGEWNCNPDDLDSAADEITRLRAEVERLTEALIFVDALDPEDSHINGLSADALRGLVLKMGRTARTILAELKEE